MELFELKENIAEVMADKEYYENEVERLEAKVGVKASDPSKKLVRGGNSDKERALLELTQMSIYLDDAIRKLDNLTKLKDKKYSIYKNANDYDKQIYMEKKLFKWSNAKISANHNGIGKSQIYRIVEKIEDKKVGEKRGKQL